jgi:DNA polymerase III subunit delta'
MTDTLLPWHKPHWDSLLARHQSGALPHALLLCGPRGLGKQIFAETLAQALLCDNPQSDGQPCRQCRACALFRSGAHPDYRRVGPEDDSKVIKIDQIRALCAALAMTSQYGGYQITQIAPADTLNRNAANSLLKTLEEPTPETLLFLVTDRPAGLPATILSRCQRVLFHNPPTAQARAWLQGQLPSRQDIDVLLALAEGAPLRAMALAQGDALQRRRALFTELAQVARAAADPVAVAAGWLKADLKETLDWLRTAVMDMIRLKAAGPARLVNRDLGQELQRLADGLDLQALYGHLDQLTQAARLADTSVNPQLLLEDLLIPWTQARRTH